MEKKLKKIHRKQKCSFCGGFVYPLNDILIFNCGFYYHINCFELLTGKKTKCICLN
jgi:hypothetical protein